MPRTVVIIDDSRFTVSRLEDFFSEKLGFLVLATGINGVQAVALFKQHRPDLLTLDLNMPVKDGKAALLDILAINPEACVLIISSITGPEMLECVKAGARGFVEKPLRFEDEDFIQEFTLTVEESLPKKTNPE